MSRVAIVIPCFDDGATLPEALGSLRGQEEHELVVVDDGSTDHPTLELLAELEQNGTRVVRRPNGGLSAARMTGLEATTSPYVFPLDADDVLGEAALARLADALDRDTGIAAAWGDVELFGTVDLTLRMPRTLDPWLFTFLNEVPGTCLLRRDAIVQAGGWRLSDGYEDWDLWLSFVERGFRGVYVPGTMIRYRQRPGRMNEDAIARHDAKYLGVRALHADLFNARSRLRRSSSEPWHVRLLWTAIEAMPGLSPWTRLQLCRLVRDPRRQLASRRRTAA